ncbi:MAG TPA: GGDEF domain-containing protein [Dongiaceae bacterium]|nr:GGDEF domain-containing protein [Dongiaceae bacterium]
MLSALRTFLTLATPAQRCLLAIFLNIPFLLAFMAAQSAGFFLAEWRTYMNPPWILVGNWILGSVITLELVVVAWLWPRRFDRRPLPGMYILVACLSTVGFSFEAFLGGNLTFPTSLVIIGLIPCGSLILDRRAAAVGLGLGVLFIWINDLAIFTGMIHYAPGFGPGAFVNNEQVFMPELFRSGVLYVSICAYGLLIWVLFSHSDHYRQTLTLLSNQDMLTGLANRRRFMERLQQECDRLARIHAPLCLVMIDADHFKKINDTHGHPVGDAVLKTLSHLLTQHMRVPADLPARVGGEEFAILLPDTRLEGAVAVCERIAASLRRTPLEGSNGPFYMTLSMGVVESWQLDPEQMLHYADANLYLAKGQGRNRIVASRIREEAADERVDTLA